MRKTILKFLFAVLFFTVNQNIEAQRTKSNIIVSTTLSLAQGNASDVTSYPNSTVYPDYYEVNLKVSAFVNTGQYGYFYLTSQRRQLDFDTSNPISSWSSFTPNSNQFLNTGVSGGLSSTYNGTARTFQVEGTKFEYRVIVTFNSSGPTTGSKTVYTPARTATVLGVPVPCFTMYNVNSTQNESSKYGPQPVNTICQNAVTIDGSCSKFEQGYHIRIAEFNLTSWTIVEDYYEDWVAPGEAPSFISLNGLASLNGFAFQPGKLYIVGFSIGPVWKSATPQFFRVDGSCRSSGTSNEDIKIIPKELNEVIESNDIEVLNPFKIKLYPNPTEDYFKISMSESNLVESASVIVLDSNGKEVFNGTYKTDDFQVNTEDWRPGLYICKVQIGDRIETRKIIKKIK